MDYYSKLREYVLSQFRDLDGFKEILQATANQYTDLETELNLIGAWNNIDNAEGEILDLIGYLYGTSREYFDISQYFSVNSEDLNVEKYFHFEKPASAYIVPTGSLDDQYFRARIKAKIGAKFSNKTREDNIYIIKNMTFADSVKITLASPMMLDIVLTGDNILETDTTYSDIESVLGDGVGINSLTIQ